MLKEMKPNQFKRASYIYHRHGFQQYLLFVLITTTLSSSNSHSFFSKNRLQSKWAGSNTDLHKSESDKNRDRDRYASFPPTVFSPDGRLYNVESTAKHASDMNDLSSSLVLAFTFGSDEEECVITLSTSTMSPHLYRSTSYNDDDTHLSKQDGKDLPKDEHNADAGDAISSEMISLFRNGAHLYGGEGAGKGKEQIMDRPAMPLAMVSWNIIVGTGGNAAESIVFNRRICELALSLHRSNDGIRNDNAELDQAPTQSFHSSSLARKVADMVQSPTQTVGGSNGKMLASAAMIIGGNELQSISFPKAEAPLRGHNIWRIDPTGQFWKCYAAAVGKGAGNAEAMFLRQVEKWKKGIMETEKRDKVEDQTQDLESLVNNLTNKDVQGYFRTLSFEEAMVLACRCCASALKLSKEQLVDSRFFEESGIQGLIIRSMNEGEAVYNEMIHPNIIKEAMRQAVET